jgi:hypothetical protein
MRCRSAAAACQHFARRLGLPVYRCRLYFHTEYASTFDKQLEQDCIVPVQQTPPTSGSDVQKYLFLDFTCATRSTTSLLCWPRETNLKSEPASSGDSRCKQPLQLLLLLLPLLRVTLLQGSPIPAERVGMRGQFEVGRVLLTPHRRHSEIISPVVGQLDSRRLRLIGLDFELGANALFGRPADGPTVRRDRAAYRGPEPRSARARANSWLHVPRANDHLSYLPPLDCLRLSSVFQCRLGFGRLSSVRLPLFWGWGLSSSAVSRGNGWNSATVAEARTRLN